MLVSTVFTSSLSDGSIDPGLPESAINLRLPRATSCLFQSLFLGLTHRPLDISKRKTHPTKPKGVLLFLKGDSDHSFNIIH